MRNQKVNPNFRKPLEKLEEEIGTRLITNTRKPSIVIPLRGIEKINSISVFSKGVFERLLRKVPLKNQDEFPYLDAKIKVYKISPRGARTGQRFVSEEKINGLMKGLEKRIFRDYFIEGFSGIPPIIVKGINQEGEDAVSFYSPPIIEVANGEGVFLDGAHRGYIAEITGTSIYAVHIFGVTSPLPFMPIDWDEVKLIKGKLPIEQRYKDLRKEYFRDLSTIGIDG